MKLNEIKNNPGSRKNRKRVGRGIGSGKGKTCGVGVKGQKARTGVAIKGFEGGQMPLYQRLPKRGFTNIFSKLVESINLGTLQNAIDSKKLSTDAKITRKELIEAGLIRKKAEFIKLLGHGDLKTSIEIEVNLASKSAQAAIEKAKGKLTLSEIVAKEAVEGKEKVSLKKNKSASPKSNTPLDKNPTK